MTDRMSVIDRTGIQKIHNASMALLKGVGVSFEDPEAIDIFRSHGFRTDRQTVFFDENDVLAAVEKAPSQFKLTARNGDHDLIVGGDRYVLAPGYGAPFIHSIDGDQRPATLSDYDNFCKLIQNSHVIQMNGFLMAEPSDRPPETAHLDMILSNILLCDKPFMGAPISRQGAIDCIEMAAMVWGSRERLSDHPVMASLITPLPPFRYTQEMTASIIEFARSGQGCIFGDLILAGASGPVTLAGLLAQQNAETLAGLVLTQLVHPGAPVAIGGSSSIMNMRTGGLSTGAPEFNLISTATAALARFYNLPARCGSATSDSHICDAQAGIESAFGLYTAIRNGGNFILHAAGMLSAYMAISYEKFIIDEQVCADVIKMMEPIELTDETFGLDTIIELGIGGSFLDHSTTLSRCRTAFSHSDLMFRKNQDKWIRSGRPILRHRAAEIVEKRLEDYKKPDIDPALEKDLVNFVASKKNH